MGKNAEVSVVIPVYNSAGIFPELHRRMTLALEHMVNSYEVIAVVDGCSDASFDVISEIALKDSRIKAIEFSRNFGHQVAITCGLAAATGQMVAVMDDDLEDPPEVLPNLISKINEGFDVVYGIRRKRRRSVVHRFLYRLFYRVLNRMADINLPSDSGDFCIMRKRVADVLNSMPENNRYLRGMRAWTGFKQAGVEYDREERYAGKPGYNFSKYFKLAFDAAFSFSYRPLVYVSWLGGLISLASFILGARLVILKSLGKVPEVPGWASLFAAVTFFSGIQLLCLGIIGHYLARVYDEVKRRPKYVVNRTVGFDGEVQRHD